MLKAGIFGKSYQKSKCRKTNSGIGCRHCKRKQPDITERKKHKQIEVEKKEGIYLLRPTLNTNDEKTHWEVYNTIREIEATFRILKTDLDLRPIYYKTDEASKTHLHLGLLGYWLVNTVRYQLKQKGINHNWQEIVRIMNTQKVVTTTM